MRIKITNVKQLVQEGWKVDIEGDQVRMTGILRSGIVGIYTYKYF